MSSSSSSSPKLKHSKPYNSHPSKRSSSSLSSSSNNESESSHKLDDNKINGNDQSDENNEKSSSSSSVVLKDKENDNQINNIKGKNNNQKNNDISNNNNDNKDDINNDNNNGEEKKEKMSLEHYRLAGRAPLPTIMYLSSGPILAQFTGSLKGVIGSIWVSKALGEKALTAMSTIGVYDGISKSFGFFLSASGSSKISQLYGQHLEKDASQVVVDLIRISVIIGILVPLILGLTTVPLARWLGASEEITKLCDEYMLPINIGTFTTALFIALGGCMQGEGRSLFFSILNVVSLVVNMCVLDPILLLAIKTGIWGASFAQALSEAVPGIILLFLYFKGKFGVKPKWRQFLCKFSIHTGPSLKVGLSQLIANLSQIIPSIIVRKLMGMAFGESGFNDAMASFNTVVRFFIVTNSVIIAITMGFVPCGSYSYACKNYERWFWLAVHAFWISFVWGSFTAILTWAIPRDLSRMFASGKGYLDICEPMLKYSNALGFIVGGRFCGVSYLQTLQKGTQSTLLSLASHFISIIGFSFMLYYTDQSDGVRIVWCYSLAHAFGLVLSIIVLIFPLKKMYAEYNEMKKRANQTIEENYIDDEDEVEIKNKNDELEQIGDKKKNNILNTEDSFSGSSSNSKKKEDNSIYEV